MPLPCTQVVHRFRLSKPGIFSMIPGFFNQPELRKMVLGDFLLLGILVWCLVSGVSGVRVLGFFCILGRTTAAVFSVEASFLVFLSNLQTSQFLRISADTKPSPTFWPVDGLTINKTEETLPWRFVCRRVQMTSSMVVSGSLNRW